MMRRTVLQMLGLGGASTLLSGCGAKHVASYRQKVKVIVTTPEGEKSGSAVTQIDVWSGYSLGAGEMAQAKVQGEATVVDLGQGRYLFALLNETEIQAGVVFPDGKGEKDGPKEIPQGNVAGTSNKYSIFPLLVTFDDITDPKSVKEVKPTDLASTFGAGYSLKSVTLEITDDKVTEGVVEKVIPWIDQEKLILIDWTKYPADHPLRSINRDSFRQGK